MDIFLDRLLRFIWYFAYNPDTLFTTLLSDPAFTITFGPLLVIPVLHYLRRSAPDSYVTEIDAAEPYINLGIHITSVVIGAGIFAVNSAPLFLHVEKTRDFAHLYMWLSIGTIGYFAIGIWQRFFLRAKHIEVYKAIPPSQIIAPWRIPFTYYRFGLALLSWSSTLVYVMYEQS
ncbi:hypothetical protein FHR76_001650 [Rhizobium sp. RAS22]|nr:hypothetical protein [Rhizobium sp. RAS22]